MYTKRQRGWWQREEGELYLADLLKIAIFLCLIVTFIYLPQPFIRYVQLTYFCETIVKNIELSGCINENTHLLIEELEEVYQIEPDVTFGGPFFTKDGEQRIQMQQRFTVTITDRVSIEVVKPTFGNPLTLTIPLSKKITGMSLHHWRENEILAAPQGGYQYNYG